MTTTPPPTNPTPSAGTPRLTPSATLRPPEPGKPRPRQTTAHDLQAASQEVISEGLVPTEDAIERRAILKRQGRAEAKLDSFMGAMRRLTAWQTVAIVTLWFAWPKLEAWGTAHKDMGYGLVGLAVAIVGGFVAATKFLRARAEAEGEPPPEGGA